jgi:A/G-specific adenine glycosylase
VKLAAAVSGATSALARQRALLAWYRRHARRLPWRETRDPYRIWVSEVMLQQTQVATATPYYEHFLARFPTVAALAKAPIDDVLTAWAGLGYYRRARSLHAAAATVVREHGGVVPAEAEAFGALPGVGRYTTGAVLSIAHGVRLPVLDGNVARVLARWHAQPLQVKRPADARVLWEMASTLVPARASQSGDWNQALMELGATVCTPRGPKCDACPVARWCAAHAAGRAEAYPPPAERRATVRVKRAVAWIEHRSRVLVVRRSGKRLAGLWEMPGVDVTRWADAAAALADALRELGVHATLRGTGLRVKHSITHHAIEARVWRGEVGKSHRTDGARWLAHGDRRTALTATATKLLLADTQARARGPE